MSVASIHESTWGAVRLSEPDVGVIVFEGVTDPEQAIDQGETRSAAEAFTIWLAKQGGLVRIMTVEPRIEDGEIRSVAVRYSL